MVIKDKIYRKQLFTYYYVLAVINVSAILLIKNPF